MCPSDRGQGGSADRQCDRIAGLLGRETVDRLTVETDACEISIGRCLNLIGQFVGTRILRRRSRDGDLCTFLEAVLDERNGLCTIGISGLPSDDRRFGSAQRQRDGVVVLGRCETRHEFTVDIDSLQGVVGELSDREVERVGVGGSTISCGYVDSGCARGAGGLRDSNSSTSVLCGSTDNRHFGGSVRQLHIVGIEVSIEALNTGTIDLNIRKASIVGRCGNELNLVGGGATTVGGIDLNDHRVAINSALLHDLELVAGEFATRESGSIVTCVGERTYTAHTENRRNLGGLAHRIDLLLRAVRVESLPLAFTDVEFVNLG